MEKYNLRSEVPDKYKWDLTDFYKNDEEYNKEFETCTKLIKETSKFVGKIKDKDKLYEFLVHDIKTCSYVINLYVYAMLKHDEDLEKTKYLQMFSKANKLFSDYSISISFFKPELLSLEKNEYDNLFTNKKLAEFKYLLDEIYKDKDHVLSEKEENIISMMNSAMNHFEEMASTLFNSEHDYGKIIIDGKEEEIRTTNLRSFLQNKDDKVRKEAYEKHRKVLKQYASTSASFLDCFVNSVINEAKLRKFKSAWDENLFRENMSDKAYNTLINTTEKNSNVVRKHLKMIKKVLGKKELNCYDLKLNLTKNDKKYFIEEAEELCKNALSILGEDYIKHLNKIFDNHYIDFCEYKGKRSGGYSCSTNDHDSRILLSFNNDLDSVSTIIHEAGHNVHHQYVCENNPIQYRDVSHLVAEVASLTNECLLSYYLSENSDDANEKLSGIDNLLGVIKNNLFDAVIEGKMEKDFYEYAEEGNTITKEYLCELSKKYQDIFYKNEIKENELSTYSWSIVLHNYMEFYLFSYAFCMSVACYVSSKIIKGDKEMLEKYIKFLKLGGDVYPINAIKTLGVDLEKEDVYKEAIEFYDSLIDKFEKIYKEVEVKDE